MYKSQKEVNKAFREYVKHYNSNCNPGKEIVIVPGGQNNQPTDTRAAYVDFIDWLQKCKQISDSLAADVVFK